LTQLDPLELEKLRQSWQVWTRLAETAKKGDMKIVLQAFVKWVIGVQGGALPSDVSVGL